MVDFPAAHSMDVTWFAVDEDDEVAIFETGEAGCRPTEGFPLTSDWQLLPVLLRLRARRDERLRALLPETLEELEKKIEAYEDFGPDDAYEVFPKLIRCLGVWIYEPDAEHPQRAVPYLQDGPVPSPVRFDALDELDLDVYGELAGARLPLRFAATPVLAPGEHVPVRSWDGVWWDREGRAHAAAGKSDALERLPFDADPMEPTWNQKLLNLPTFAEDELYAVVERILSV